MLRTDSQIHNMERLILGLLLFVLLSGLYLWGAYHLRAQAAHGQATVSPKLMPLPSEMWAGFKRMAFEPDQNGDYRLWTDTAASLTRFAEGMGIVAFGVIIGLYMGTFPFWEACLSRFFVFMDKVPPVCLLPILFIVFDIGEVSKVALVVIGVLPGVVLDAYLKAKEVPREQIQKAQTLGASETEIAWTVILPQILPKMIDTLRLNFKAAWCYVLVAEGLAASVGIGYRVFIMRRFTAMDVIIPYVIWATVIFYLFDFAFQWWASRYRWAGK